MDNSFNKWCEKLLDTGKRNKLINYKESNKTMNIIYPDIQVVFKKLINNHTLTFYDVDSYIKKRLDENKEKNQLINVKKDEILDALSNELASNEILAFNKGLLIKPILTNIKRIVDSTLYEKGINVLYIAFGFLKWKEEDEPKIWYESPLVLLPITLNYESSNKPFDLKLLEDEITTNPTLLYKFEHENDIKIPKFRDDNEEETLLEYFDRVEKSVEKQGFSVKPNMAIGTFSFLKINMYEDLKENEEKILANPTIQKLLNREVTKKEETNEVDIDDYFRRSEELNLHNVVDADSSQMTAIIKAKCGKNLVLQGPPGTGKSQTITNLIAEYLYEGKKILFVSEKLTALNVVFNNLKRVGLSDFCLELHSNKTNKKDVVKELYRVLKSGKKEVSAKADNEILDLKKSKNQLDSYVENLHSVVNNINLTTYEILSIISSCRNYPAFEYSINDIQDKGEEYFNNAILILNNFISYLDLIGYDYHNHIWYGYNKLNSVYQTKINLKQNLKACLSTLQKYLKQLNIVSNNLQIKLNDRHDVNKYLPILETLHNLNYFDNSFFDLLVGKNLLEKIKTYNKNLDDLINAKAEVEKIFTNEIYELNLKEYYLRFKNEYISFFRFLNKNYNKDKKVLKQYFIYNKTKLNYKQFVEVLKYAKTSQELESNIKQNKQEILELLDDKKNINVDLKDLQNKLENLYLVMDKEIPVLKTISKTEFSDIQKSITNFITINNEFNNDDNLFLELQNYFDKNVCDFMLMDFNCLENKLSGLIDNFNEFENYARFYNILNKLKELDLLDFVDKSIENNIDRKTLDMTYKLIFYTEWLWYIIDNDNVLHDFSRLSQDNACANFKKKDKLKFEISKAEIISKLTKEIPNLNNMAPDSQVSLLVREANKKSKLRPVRILLRDVGKLIQTLKPCFLMSPLSVSTYLDSNTCKFDVVIFDEASQIYPWDAIGAISRGKQVIVVGDSKQMPPSNFFNANMFDDNMEEYADDEDDSLDFESILDLSNATFEQTRLNWHYRSKTEELIAFSNANFYDNSLITFPSSSKDNKDMGVDFYYVPNGVFSRKTKTNEIEAQKVVDLVFEHFKNYPNRSLGVVAFSISQQEMIENLISKRREENDEFAEFFDMKREEPFFVKNLETVQGDERDTIIFSVAYAKDSQGKFIHNFGPLNKKGGERRLNVAITRAKYNVKLVSSIRSYDIDLNKTGAVGSKMLKGYLAYAENGFTKEEEKYVGSDKPNFANEIYDFLKENGYNVERNVGCSAYRIDVGIKCPNSVDFALAVECDGENYKNNKTTRDRDRLRQEVLEKLGWKFYRIWSIDWFLNKETEKKKLLQAVNKSIENFEKANAELLKKNDKTNLEEKQDFLLEQKFEETGLKTGFKIYESYEINYSNKPQIEIYNLIKTEAPITENLLLKEVASLFGREKVTSFVKDELNKVLKHKNSIIKVKDYYITDKNMEIELRVPKDGEVRDIINICNDELESGMLKIIKNNVGIKKDGLFLTISNLLGYSKRGEKINQKLNECLFNLIKSKKIIKDNDEFFIAPKNVF